MKKENKGFLTIVLLILASMASGQVQIGSSVEELVQSVTTKKVIKSGKPVIIEFFGEQCIVCVKMLPKIDSLDKLFRDKVSFVLIGNEHEQLPKTFGLYKKKYNLSMDIICDSVMYKKVKPPYQPFFVWVDDNGIVVGFSSPTLVTSENIKLFVEKKYDFFESHQKVVANGAGDLIESSGRNVVVQSVFFETKDSSVFRCPFLLKLEHSDPQLKFINVKLNELCFIAWFGRLGWMRGESEYEDTWPRVVIEGDDKFVEMMDSKVSYFMRFRAYRPTYYLQKFLINDIQRTFNIEGSIQIREMPCWVVYRSDTSSRFFGANHNGGHAYMKDTYGGIYVKAMPFTEVLRVVELKTQVKLPIIDESGIRWPVDLDVSAVMTDWDEVVSALRGKGILFKLEKRYMRVLVVRKRGG